MSDVNATRKRGGKIKHGHAQVGKVTREYRRWLLMRQRCLSEECPDYPNYGGRGIKVCERWNDFANFLADMGPCPSGLELDRYPNKHGNYEPGNCRWATRKQQTRNMRSNHTITFGGKTQCISAWADETGILPRTLWMRIVHLKWPVELALTVPVRKRVTPE